MTLDLSHSFTYFITQINIVFPDMKIAFIGGRDIHILGGIENYMYNLATQLVKIGHEPVVFCESDHDGDEIVNGFKVIHMTSPRSNYVCKPWLGIKATLYAVRKLKVDFIHYNACGPAWGQYIAMFFHTPYLIQGHGLEWERTKYTKFQRHLLKMSDTFQMRNSKNLIVVSDVQRSYWMRKFGRDVLTVPTAITLPDVSEDIDNSIFSRYGLEPGHYFLYLARLVQEKNPDYLIKSFLKVKSPGMKLVIAGDNPADPDYVAKLHSLGEGDVDIVFTGAVYGDDKKALLRNTFAFCVPSTIEGLSISLLEGMGYRLPIIASNIQANKEVLESDKAFWCQPEDIDSLASAIKDAVERQELHKEMTDYNYRKVASSYTWESVTAKYINHISDLVNNRSGKGE